MTNALDFIHARPGRTNLAALRSSRENLAVQVYIYIYIYIYISDVNLPVKYFSVKNPDFFPGKNGKIWKVN